MYKVFSKLKTQYSSQYFKFWRRA